MIVGMKKAAIIVLKKERTFSVKALGKLGVVHITSMSNDSETWETLQAEHDILSKARISIIGDTKKKKKIRMEQVGYDKALEIAAEINNMDQQREAKKTELQQVLAEKERLAPWGSLDPSKLKALEEENVFVGLVDMTKEELSEIPPDVFYITISSNKKSIQAAIVSVGKRIDVPGKPVSLPDKTTEELSAVCMTIEKEIDLLTNKIEHFKCYEESLSGALDKNTDKKEFEEVKTGMQDASEVAYFSGFVPVTALDDLKKAVSENGWGVMLVDPDPEDRVPTLLKNPKPIRIIKPMFDFLGTVPGYKEFDISLWFLMFFSIFYGMLIGDAGYGTLFLLITIIARIILRKAPYEIFALLGVTSIATIAWGGLTGTWFGSETISNLWFLKWMRVEAIYSFANNTTNLLMFICFILGITHLTIARLRSFIRKMPSLIAFAELGWLSILWGMFFLVLMIVLGQDMNPATLPLIGAGFGLLIVFNQQKGKFFKGVLSGLLNLPLNILSAIGSFSDIVSYVRLYAVGLASLELAKAFNGMAEGVGFSGPAIIGAVLILFLGHALNIILGFMGVIVHGVRLNMLEFSGHLGMEWSGKEYKPFIIRNSN